MTRVSQSDHSGNGTARRHREGLRSTCNCWQIVPANKIEEDESADLMVRVSANFDAPGLSYGHFLAILRPLAGHGRAENCETERDPFGSDWKNSKIFVSQCNAHDASPQWPEGTSSPFVCPEPKSSDAMGMYTVCNVCTGKDPPRRQCRKRGTWWARLRDTRGPSHPRRPSPTATVQRGRKA